MALYRKMDSGLRRNDGWWSGLASQPAAFSRTGNFQSGRMKWQV